MTTIKSEYFVDQDTGQRYVLNKLGGTTDSNGNDAGRVVVSNGSHFRPSSYTGDITSVNAGVGVAIATGATKLMLQSFEHTGMEEGAVLTFGEGADSTEAIANLNISTNVATAGIIIYSGDSTAGGVAPSLIIEIPTNATYFALGNHVAGADQVIRITQGV